MHTEDLILLGWAGVELRIPRSWEPAVLQPAYLLAHHGETPALDLKTSAAGKKPLDRAMKRLRKRLRIDPMDRDALPEAWREATDALSERGFECRLFSWSPSGKQKADAPDAGMSGVGAAVHCPVCERLMVLRFFDHDGDAHGPVLGSLVDHGPAGPDGLHAPARIAVFDIRALPLPGLTLHAASFQPGAFRVELRGKAQVMILDRLSPANVLLRGKPLEEFADSVLPMADVLDDPIRLEPPDPEGEALEWDCDLARGPLKRLGTMLPGAAIRRERRLRLRLWTLPQSNRILGLQVKSRRKLDAATFHALCMEFSVVS